MKFKKGDQVLYIGNRHPLLYRKKGVIIESSQNRYRVAFRGIYGDGFPYVFWCNDNEVGAGDCP